MNLSDITWPLCNIRITLSGSFLTNPANLTGFLPLIRLSFTGSSLASSSDSVKLYRVLTNRLSREIRPK